MDIEDEYEVQYVLLWWWRCTRWTPYSSKSTTLSWASQSVAASINRLKPPPEWLLCQVCMEVNK